MRKFLLPAVFVKSQFNLCVNALKIFYSYMYKLCIGFYNDWTFRIKLSFFVQYANIGKRKSLQEYIKQFNRLNITFINLSKPQKFKIFSRVRLVNDELEVTFKKKFTVFLKDNSSFAAITLDSIYSFKSVATIQMYILFTRYQNIRKTGVIPINELKIYLGFSVEIRNNQLFTRHIYKAIDDLEKYFHIDIKINRFGREIISVQFMYNIILDESEDAENERIFVNFFRFPEAEKQRLFDKYSKDLVIEKAKQIYNMAGENKIFHVRPYLKKILANHFADKRDTLKRLEIDKLDSEIAILKSKLISSYEAFISINFNDILNAAPTDMFLDTLRTVSDAFSKSIYGEIYRTQGLRSSLVQAQLIPVVRPYYPNLFERLLPFNDYVFKFHQGDFAVLRMLLSRVEKLRLHKPVAKPSHHQYKS